MNMTNSLALLQDGIAIMLIGMGVVFAFLTIMVYVMDFNAVLIKKLNKYFPEEVPQQAKPRKKRTEEDDKIALAVAIAHAKSQAAM